ncbi:Gmad2 immunoglobulin-like domain-containing protein [Nocardioides sp. TF02-7]|uniref:Gmad2 immunoglobulin-like domain-containing protein n=1 Tax=Nocardioides sp. TF02-7 TaxID=2917724 RepID=UPI001F05B68A|nr:Gmad2 immunoglobulin-like domain-containing protein [Nocardioides sp. TF02-7]UMG92911.1 hypothetical protein MF408_00560 [Nocardioides sp. TF02-7]
MRRRRARRRRRPRHHRRPRGLQRAADAGRAGDDLVGPGRTELRRAGGDGGRAGVLRRGRPPQGPRLFAEVRAVEADDPLEEATALLTAGDAEDPDYTTLFPGDPDGMIASVEVVDETFVVEVDDDGWSTPPSGMNRREARLAVQQLVHTLQAAEGRPYPLVVQSGGSAVPLFGVATDGGVTAAKELNVRGLVNVLSPVEGTEVSGTFTAEGEASSFEATVPWQVRDERGRVVAEGFSTAEGWVDGLYPWTAEVDVSRLAPGEYTFVAMTDDPSGGEGFGPTEDTKTVVVG